MGKVLAWLIVYKYFLLFPVLVFEGPIVTVMAGLLVSLGHLAPVVTFATAIAADIVGTTLYYVVGRYGARWSVLRRFRPAAAGTSQLAAVARKLHRHLGKTLLTAKMTPGVGGLVLLASGAFEVPFPAFLGWNTLGAFPRSFLLLLLGFYFGHAWQEIDNWFQALSVAAVLLAAAALVYFAYGARRRSPPRP